MKIAAAVVFLLILPLFGQTTSIKVTQVEVTAWPPTLSRAISFSCTTDYDPADCLAGAAMLAKVLARYPTERLGQWRFVLAGSTHWGQTVKSLGGDTETPAFSDLGARATVLEDELFENRDSRKAMLANRFGLTAAGILDFAVTHEMGHAICGERDEKQAEKYGLDLRRGIALTCANGHKPSSSSTMTADARSR
jgi:hypothetical protein